MRDRGSWPKPMRERGYCNDELLCYCSFEVFTEGAIAEFSNILCSQVL